MPEIIPNLHPAVVHFPIALVTASLLFHAAAILFKKKAWAMQLATVGHYTLWLGAASSVAAVAFGWQAFNSVNHDDVSHAAMLVHRSWALPTMGLLILLAAFDIWKSKATQVMSLAFIVPLAIICGLVMTTGWYGAELVYRHGLGVMRMPESEMGAMPGKEGDAHQHEHSKVDAAHDDESQPHTHK